jgi:hypothetical protein
MTPPDTNSLLAKLNSLSAPRFAEVEDFVDSLLSRDDDSRLATSASAALQASFAKVWDNDDDAEYDRL